MTMDRSSHSTDPSEFWDRCYRTRPVLFGTDPSGFARRSLAWFQQVGVQRVLELGCGYGRDSLSFSQAGCDTVAVDCSIVGCRALKRRLRECRSGPDEACSDLCVLCADVAVSFPFRPASFDAVYLHLLLHQNFNARVRRRILTDAARVLDENGCIALSVRSTDDPWHARGEPVGDDRYRYRGQVRHFFDAAELSESLQVASFLPVEVAPHTLALDDGASVHMLWAFGRKIER